jgi:DNA modification methylase
VTGTSKSRRYKIIFATSERIAPEDVAPESVKVAITSPPYWDLKDYETPGQIGRGDADYKTYLDRIRRVWVQVRQSLARDGVFCLNANTKYDNRARSLELIPWDLAKIAIQVGFHLRDIVIWHKSTAIPRHDRDLKDNYEWVFLFTTTEMPVEKYLATEINFMDYALTPPPIQPRPNIWNLNKKAGSVGIPGVQHPAIFHEDLPGRMIQLFSRPGDLILDPFLGSGTTLAEAFRWERSCVGYEINNGDFWTYMQRMFAKVLPATSSPWSIRTEPPNSNRPVRAEIIFPNINQN